MKNEIEILVVKIIYVGEVNKYAINIKEYLNLFTLASNLLKITDSSLIKMIYILLSRKILRMFT